jgi:hypothetical protein
MDPYLERHWGDVHSAIITFAKVALQPQLGGELVARAEERVYIDDEDAMRIVERGISDVPVRAAGGAPGGLAVAEPVVLQISWEPITERFIQIIDAKAGGRVVTVIEFVSPSNKLFKNARKSYQNKQEECLDAGASLVEVDLTRAGHRQLLVQDTELPADVRGEYLVSVFRAYAGRQGRREGYGLKLRDRLPAIRIPLRAGDPDVVLDLQSMVDQAYEAGAHGRTIDYANPCDPPLEGDDAAWANELLRAAGKR